MAAMFAQNEKRRLIAVLVQNEREVQRDLRASHEGANACRARFPRPLPFLGTFFGSSGTTFRSDLCLFGSFATDWGGVRVTMRRREKLAASEGRSLPGKGKAARRKKGKGNKKSAPEIDGRQVRRVGGKERVREEGCEREEERETE